MVSDGLWGGTLSDWAAEMTHEHLLMLAKFGNGFGRATTLLRLGRMFGSLEKAPG